LAMAFLRPAARAEAAVKIRAYSTGVVNALFG
jgi:hypothetical protein